MLFIRCRGGVSRSPAEHVLDDDVWASGLALFEYTTRIVLASVCHCTLCDPTRPSFSSAASDPSALFIFVKVRSPSSIKDPMTSPIKDPPPIFQQRVNRFQW
ncbi:hypothetical protein F8388_020278 [Cannabis sativa]|uniref:Uncharacterized protein n=1 Tax=Cannabis sativa TaxID=3483 RepID=A0A7J6FVU6_CANSA|nr:hypothetical protein F8388_020278 [Cannabis sativa]